MPRITILNRYLFTTFLTAFVLTASSLVFIVLITQSFRLLSFVLNNAGTAVVFIRLMILGIPTLLPVVLPLSLALAVLFVMHQVMADSEFVVMRAAGISLRDLSRPLLLLACLVAIASLITTLWIDPIAKRERRELEYKVRNTWSAFLIRPGIFNDLAPNLTFYAAGRGAEGGLTDILVQDSRKPSNPVTLMAQAGRMESINGVPHLVVFQGRRQELDVQTGQMTELSFESYVLNLETTRETVETRRIPKAEKTLDDLLRDDPSTQDSRWHMVCEIGQRCVVPFLVLSYALVAFIVLVFGEHNRRGLARRIMMAGLILTVMQGTSMALDGLADKHAWAVLVLYAMALLPIPLTWRFLND